MRSIILVQFALFLVGTAAFGDYQCQGTQAETLAVMKIEYKIPKGHEDIDLSHGVPQELILKKTELNPQIFDGSYESMAYASKILPPTDKKEGKGEVMYRKSVETGLTFKILSRCNEKVRKRSGECFYDIASETGKEPQWHWVRINTSQDRTSAHASTLGMFSIKKGDKGMQISILTSRHGTNKDGNTFNATGSADFTLPVDNPLIVAHALGDGVFLTNELSIQCVAAP